MKRIAVVFMVLMLMAAFASNGICAFEERPAVAGDLFHKGRSGEDVRSHFATGDGITDDSAAFTNAIAAAAGGRVIVSEARTGTYKIAGNVTVPSGVTIEFRQGGLLSVDNGITFAIAEGASVEAGQYQIMSGAGTLTLGAGVCDYTLPQWWGAVSDGSTDDTAAIEAAITAAQAVGTCYIPSGTYAIDSTIDNCWPNSGGAGGLGGLVVRGAGESDTILKYTGTTGYCIATSTDNTTDAFDGSNSTIRDLHIQAPNIADPDDGGGIVLIGAFNTIQKVTFTDHDDATAIAHRMRNINSPVTATSYTNDTDRDFTTTGAGASEKYAIKFTTGPRVHGLRSVTVRLGKTGAPAGTIHAEIWTNVAGSPGAQVNDDSATVTNTDLSAAADGADVTFSWIDYQVGNGTSLTASTDYWLVLSTTGYTYTNGATEVRLRAEAGAGVVNGFSTFTWGGAWAETNDGSNHNIIIKYGQSIMGRVTDCYMSGGSGRVGRGFWILDDSIMFVDQTYARTVAGLRVEGFAPSFWASNLYLDANPGQVIYINGGGSKWTTCWLEGSGTASQLIGTSQNHLFSATRLGNVEFDTVGPNMMVKTVGCWGGTFETTDKTFIYDDFAIPNIISAANESNVQASGSSTNAVDANALGGFAEQMDAVGEFWSARFQATLEVPVTLAPGNYRITVWAKDTNQVATDFRISSAYYDGSYNVIHQYDTTLTASYAPYEFIHNIETSHIGPGQWTRIIFQKRTGSANTINVSHFVVQYIGTIDLGTTNVVIYSTDNTDADRARAGDVRFIAHKSGGEQITTAMIRASHDGAVDDDKGVLEIYTNDGNDEDVPTLAAYWDSVQELYLKIGVGVSEISDDDTLGGDSDDVIVTEQAIKAYVDGAVGGVANDTYVEEGDVARVDTTGADMYLDFDGTDFAVGVVGNEGNVTITDDGHAHTGVSLSGIDISDDTNFAVTVPITLIDDTVGITVAKDIVVSGTGMSGGEDNVLPGADADTTITLTTAKDIVASGTGMSGGEDDVLPGADADVTITLTTAKDIVAGNGLTGGEDNVLPGADADTTLAVGGGDGVIVNADEIEVYGLVASDGTPNDAVAVDATGNVTIGPGTKHDGYVIRDAAEVQTVDATANVALDTLTLLDENTYLIKAKVVAVQSDGSTSAVYEITTGVKRTGGGGATLFGSVVSLITSEQEATWDCTFTVTGNDVRVAVTGEGGTTIEWGCTMSYINMSN